jgi:hypothetical protein
MLDKREPHARKSFKTLDLDRMPGRGLPYSPFRTPDKAAKKEGGQEEVPPNTADFILEGTSVSASEVHL